MPQTTPRGVPYVVGGDVAGAYPETSAALANYINDRVVQKSGDTMTGDLLIRNPSGYSLVKTLTPTGGFWLGTDPGASGAFTLARTDAAGNFTGPAFAVTTSGSVVLSVVPEATGKPGSSGYSSLWLLATDGTSGEVRRVLAWGVSAAAVGSSRRFKQDVHQVKGPLPDVTRLQPVTFRYLPGYTGSTREHLGLIAEDAAALDPRLAMWDEDGQPAGLDLPALVASLIGKVTELQSRIGALEARP